MRTSLAAALIAALATAGHAIWTHSGGNPQGDRVIVSKVYDGDTIVVGRGLRKTTVRLIGVDTPETVHPDKPVQFKGPEAADFTRRSLESRWVRLEFDAPDRPGGSIDHYGRTLAYVITEDGKNFNLELIRQGYGRAYTRFPFRYISEFREAERMAREQGRGLWSKTKRSAPSDSAPQGRIIGNTRSRIYHVPGQRAYGKVSEINRIYFDSEDEAQRAGYRKAKN